MKKTILKSLLLGVAALTAMTASAENKLIIDDFEIAPGEMKEIPVYVENDAYFSAFQFELEDVKGLNFLYAALPAEGDIIQLEYDEHWPHRQNGTAVAVSIADNADVSATNPDLLFGVVMNHSTTYSNSQKYIVPFGIGQGVLCLIGVQATDEFEGGQLICHYAKGDYSDPVKPEWVGSFEFENQVICDVTLPVAATPLATIVAEGVDNTEYTVADALHIAAKAPNCVFVTDGQGNWMKVAAEGEILANLLAWDDIKANTLVGTLSEANCNQTLTVTKAATEATAPVTAELNAWNLAQDDPDGAQYHFAPKTNEVIKLTGYWFDGEFRGYANNTGQSATADMSWCTSNTAMVDGQLYKDVVSVVQLKAPWDNGTKVAADDELAFQNYKVYPISVEDDNVVTGVETLNGDKSIVSVQYVNVAGQVANTPFNGVNMVVTRYADGSTVTTKVIK